MLIFEGFRLCAICLSVCLVCLYFTLSFSYPKGMKFPKLAKLLVSIAACLLAGLIGSTFTAPNIQGWYSSLNRPSFTPPNQIFGPVWTLLYILMGVSVFLVWNKSVSKKQLKFKRSSLYLFGFQLLLNLLWSFLFFNLHYLLISVLEILLLWLCILVLIIRFKKLSKTASYLLIPYLLWVSFASVLNFSFWWLNR